MALGIGNVVQILLFFFLFPRQLSCYASSFSSGYVSFRDLLALLGQAMLADSHGLGM